MKHSLLAFSMLFTAGVPALAQIGSVLHEQKINEVQGGFSGALDRNEYFGASVAALGDLDGDGVGELAVGAFYDGDGGIARGAVWIVFLHPNGTVKSETKISQTSGGFTGTLADQAYFGLALAAIGDLDGDGRRELAVTAARLNRVYVLHLAANGTVSTHTEISSTDPVFGGTTEPQDFIHGGLGCLGDVDGNGVEDLAWGAPEDDDGNEDAGAVWLLRLDATGAATSASKIAMGSSGFTGVLEEDSYFGYAVEPLGDVNGDGYLDLGVVHAIGDALGGFWTLFLDANLQVVGHRALTMSDFAMCWESPLGHTRCAGVGDDFAVLDDLDGDGIREIALGVPAFRGGGGLAIGFLAADGRLRKRLAVGNSSGGLAPDPDRGYLGYSVAALGDMDGDGSPEIAAGDPGDGESGIRVGSVSVLELDPDAVRAGANPLTLSAAAEPALGVTWTATLDCSAHGSGLAFLGAWERASSGTFFPAGELLVDASSLHLFMLVAPHAGAAVLFATAVPNDLALVNLVAHVQGLCTGAPLARLSNALDVVVGL